MNYLLNVRAKLSTATLPVSQEEGITRPLSQLVLTSHFGNDASGKSHKSAL